MEASLLTTPKRNTDGKSSSSPTVNNSTPFKTPLKLDPFEPIISPVSRRPLKDSNEFNKIYGASDDDAFGFSFFSGSDISKEKSPYSTPNKCHTINPKIPSIVVTDEYRNCSGENETRIVLMESKGRIVYKTTPLMSNSGTPKSVRRGRSTSRSRRSKGLNSSMESNTESVVLRRSKRHEKKDVEVDSNNNQMEDLNNNIASKEDMKSDDSLAVVMAPPKKQSTFLNETTDSIREFRQAHPVLERLAPIIVFILFAIAMFFVAGHLYERGVASYIMNGSIEFAAKMKKLIPRKGN